MPYVDIIHKGRVVGQQYVHDGPVIPEKKTYSLSQWLNALADDELDVLLDLVHSTTTNNAVKRARRIWAYWTAKDLIDFNDPRNVQILTFLVANSGGVWTEARKTELIG